MGSGKSVGDVLDVAFEGQADDGEPPLRFCPSCGSQAGLMWKHCARCGDPLPWTTTSDSARRVPGRRGDALREERWSKALSLLRQSKIDEASAIVSQLLENYPDDAEGRALAATVLMRRYEIDEAREHLDRALQLSPDSAVVHLCEAHYWLALGLAPQAMDALAKAEVAAADDLPLFNEIRSSITQLREKTRWNFSLQTSLPANSWLSRLFKRR